MAYDLKILNETKIAEDVFFFCAERGENWTPKTTMGVRKFGEIKPFMVSFNKPTYVSLSDNVTKANLKESVENGTCLKFEPAEMIEICKEVGYLAEPSYEQIRKVANWFVNGVGEDYEYGREWGSKIKAILTEEELSYFHEWEEMVGYTDTTCELFGRELTNREYNCEGGELEGAVYVISHSQRLMNCVIYWMSTIKTETTLSEIYNYLLCYKHKESFVELMYFSDWVENDPDELMKKYEIVDEIVERKDIGFLSKNDCSLRVGKDYKMAMQITASFDDWDGFAVVVPIDCPLNPAEIISAGESIWAIEENESVKMGLVRQ